MDAKKRFGERDAGSLLGVAAGLDLLVRFRQWDAVLARLDSSLPIANYAIGIVASTIGNAVPAGVLDGLALSVRYPLVFLLLYFLLSRYLYGSRIAVDSPELLSGVSAAIGVAAIPLFDGLRALAVPVVGSIAAHLLYATRVESVRVSDAYARPPLSHLSPTVTAALLGALVPLVALGVSAVTFTYPIGELVDIALVVNAAVRR